MQVVTAGKPLEFMNTSKPKAKTQTLRVVYDTSFGFGPSFRVADAEISEKMVRFENYSNHRRSHTLMALATPELVAEAQEIERMMEEATERARKFRKLLKSQAI